MRKIILALAALAVSLSSMAQMQITTKKMKIADFPEKITKVVLSGNAMQDGLLQNAIKTNWTISPVEFCTLDEYKELNSSPEYYFLLLVESKFKGESEPSIEFLSLVKGGVGASEGENGLYQVVDVPFRSIEGSSGREYVLLPALLDIIQDYVSKAMDSDVEGYSGLSNANINLGKSKGMEIVFSEDDLGADLVPSTREKYFKEGMSVVSADEADEIFQEGRENTLVSFVVAPSDPEQNSQCYKMLIDSATHKLYYYKTHKITQKYGAGFLTEDLKRISSGR